MNTSRQIQLLLIRFAGLGLRLVFFALFFRYSEALYGRYGIVAVSILMGTYLLGFEFYTYVQREWLKPETGVRHPFLHQLAFYLMLYPVVLPLFYLLFYYGFLDRSYLLWFYAVLVAEHLATELYRMQFVLNKPLLANLNLFFRSGFWTLPALWQLYTKGSLDIPHILQYWLLGDLLALATALWTRTGAGHSSPERRSWDPAWIRKGLKASFPFFLAVVHYKAVEFSDRYIIDWFRNDVELGVYTFFANMSLLVNTVVYTAVVSVMYPEVTRSLLNPDGRTAEIFRRFRRQILRWTLVAAAVALAGMPVLLWLLGKQVRLAYYDVFVVLVAANAVYNLSLIYHYVLYAHHKDWLLSRAVIAAAVFNLVANLILVPRLGIRAAAWSTLGAMWIIYWIKKRKAAGFLAGI